MLISRTDRHGELRADSLAYSRDAREKAVRDIVVENGRVFNALVFVVYVNSAQDSVLSRQSAALCNVVRSCNTGHRNYSKLELLLCDIDIS